MNGNIFDPDDYALQVTVVTTILPWARYTWRVNLYGMPFECAREYTTPRGARQAGERWLKKYIHEDIL